MFLVFELVNLLKHGAIHNSLNKSIISEVPDCKLSFLLAEIEVET